MITLSELIFDTLELEECLEIFFEKEPQKKKLLLETTEKTIYEAEQGNTEAKDEVIRSLYLLQDELYRSPLEKKSWDFEHPILYNIRYNLEKSWEKGWISSSKLNLNEIPEEPTEFARWLKKYCQTHPVINHNLWSFLHSEGTIEDLKDYTYYLGAFDVHQAELYARATVGLPDEIIRIEISKNYWDELGLGEESECHSAWATKFAEAIEMYDKEESWFKQITTIPIPILERFVIAQYVSARRKNWLQVIGHLGATELFDPKINVHIVKLGKRLGLNNDDLEYFIKHIQIDSAIHGPDWLNKVVIPICQEDPNNRFSIALGAEWNLESFSNSYDVVLQLLKNKKALIR